MGKPENTAEPALTGGTDNTLKEQLDAEKKINDNIMSIRLTADGLVINESNEASDTCKKLPGVYCHGTQYYDLQGVQYLSNHGLAILIDLMRNLLEIGVEVQFVNVDAKIKRKIRRLGLEGIINCGESEET